MKMVWLMLSSLIPSLMGEVKNLRHSLFKRFSILSSCRRSVDENGAVVDAEQPGPLPHG